MAVHSLNVACSLLVLVNLTPLLRHTTCVWLQDAHLPGVGRGCLPTRHLLCERRCRPDGTAVVHRACAAAAHFQRYAAHCMAMGHPGVLGVGVRVLRAVVATPAPLWTSEHLGLDDIFSLKVEGMAAHCTICHVGDFTYAHLQACRGHGAPCVALPTHVAGHQSDVDVVSWHPNSHYVATGSSDRTVRLWDVATGKACCCCCC